VSNIGSANLNTRSVAWDEEVNLVAVDHELTALLDDQFDQDLERSVRFERGRWEQRALRQRLAERAVTPLKRWF
jgi:cardiolipin synthase